MTGTPAPQPNRQKERRDYLDALCHDLAEARRCLDAAAMRITFIGTGTAREESLTMLNSGIAGIERLKRWAEEAKTA